MAEEEKVRLVARNKKAYYNYEITEKIEAGLVLKGSEVKSIRNGKVSIHEGFARLREGAFWIVGMDISQYPQAGPFHNHEPRRPRKLLLHKYEIRRLIGKSREKGLTLVPLALYFRKGLAKLELGLARGKRQYDKRDSIKRREHQRDMRKRMMKR